MARHHARRREGLARARSNRHRRACLRRQTDRPGDPRRAHRVAGLRSRPRSRREQGRWAARAASTATTRARPPADRCEARDQARRLGAVPLEAGHHQPARERVDAHRRVRGIPGIGEWRGSALNALPPSSRSATSAKRASDTTRPRATTTTTTACQRRRHARTAIAHASPFSARVPPATGAESPAAATGTCRLS